METLSVHIFELQTKGIGPPGLAWRGRGRGCGIGVRSSHRLSFNQFFNTSQTHSFKIRGNRRKSFLGRFEIVFFENKATVFFFVRQCKTKYGYLMLAHISDLFTKTAVQMEDISFIASVPLSASVSKKQQLRLLIQNARFLRLCLAYIGYFCTHTNQIFPVTWPYTTNDRMIMNWSGFQLISKHSQLFLDIKNGLLA